VSSLSASSGHRLLDHVAIARRIALPPVARSCLHHLWRQDMPSHLLCSASFSCRCHAIVSHDHKQADDNLGPACYVAPFALVLAASMPPKKSMMTHEALLSSQGSTLIGGRKQKENSKTLAYGCSQASSPLSSSTTFSGVSITPMCLNPCKMMG
jgi:hypothetical protein